MMTERNCASKYKPSDDAAPEMPLVGAVPMWWNRMSSLVKSLASFAKSKSPRSVRNSSASGSRQSASRRMLPAMLGPAASAVSNAASHAVPRSVFCRRRNWPSIRNAFVQRGFSANVAHCEVLVQICLRN